MRRGGLVYGTNLSDPNSQFQPTFLSLDHREGGIVLKTADAQMAV